MDHTRNEKINVLMLPWLAHGHASPFLELAKKLTRRNICIYFCSTPVILSSLKNRITEKYSLSIKPVEISLPSLPELPPHYHTTNGLPTHLNAALLSAFEMASPTFSNILSTLHPNLVIYDFNLPWAPTIASSYNIPAVLFITTSAFVFSFGLHLFKKHGDSSIEFPFPAVQLQRFQELLLRRRDGLASSEGSIVVKLVLEAIKGSCKVVLFNTFSELEGKYIDYVSVLAEKKIVPVGPLVQEYSGYDEDKEHNEIMEWLDKKGEFSTVFVSFGTEHFLSEEEMEEVAHGLELSKVNFIWVVRFRMGDDDEEVVVKNNTIAEVLPSGFLERVGDRGLVLEGWGPQAKILAHSSTGGFVSHCGWNSIMESLKFGVPIIAMPMHFDQPPNAGLLAEEVGVAEEVQRDENGRLRREEIARVIRKVVLEKNGEDIRNKARQVSDKIGMKAGEEEIDEAVGELLQLCEEWKLLKT